MQKKYFLIVLVLCCFSCKPKLAQTNTNLLYFDISGFFNKEAERLKKLNPTVEKLVSINGNTERKTVKISDWEKELTIFANADINKSAWRGSFNIKKVDNTIYYDAKDPKVSVKQVAVESFDKQVRKIVIVIGIKNILYQSNDTLIYQPNISYQINKQQHIKFLNSKNYKILANFK